jgi:transcriptional regulator with GAF, ATPase, and Fis domain
MNSIANVRSMRPEEDEREDASKRTGTLIKAALSLSQALDALSSLNFHGELKLPNVKNGLDFYEEVRHFESALILEALRLTHGKQTSASSLLGLNPTTLNCMIKRLGIDCESFTKTQEEQQALELDKNRGRENVQSLRHELTRK